MDSGARSMTIIENEFDGYRTFSLIPISLECPFNEAVYNPAEQMLMVISKEKKASYRLLEPHKVRDLATNEVSDSKRKEDSRIVPIDTYYEYYLKSYSNIIDFVHFFASNSETFDYKKYISDGIKHTANLSE